MLLERGDAYIVTLSVETMSFNLIVFLASCSYFKIIIKQAGSWLAWISSDYFESLLLPQLLRGENDSKQSDEFQASSW